LKDFLLEYLTANHPEYFSIKEDREKARRGERRAFVIHVKTPVGIQHSFHFSPGDLVNQAALHNVTKKITDGNLIRHNAG